MNYLDAHSAFDKCNNFCNIVARKAIAYLDSNPLDKNLAVPTHQIKNVQICQINVLT